MGIKIIAENRKGRFNFEIMERFEAGVVLEGTEVKSARAGKMNINDSYAIVRNNELFWINAHISHYIFGNLNNHDPTRTRKLLVHRSEVKRLIGVTREKGLSLIPLKAYWKKGKVKLDIGIGRGRKMFDKREVKRDQDWQRQKQRLLKQNVL